jgi:hypothetical protein
LPPGSGWPWIIVTRRGMTSVPLRSGLLTAEDVPSGHRRLLTGINPEAREPESGRSCAGGGGEPRSDFEPVREGRFQRPYLGAGFVRKRGRASAISNHGALTSTKMCPCGRRPGSSSSVPAGMLTSCSSLLEPAPHILCKRRYDIRAALFAPEPHRFERAMDL